MEGDKGRCDVREERRWKMGEDGVRLALITLRCLPRTSP